jgi:hypothetical protein
VLEPQLYSERPPRNEYVLTAKGKDLYGVLVTLHGWGAKHVYGEADAGFAMIHESCGQHLKPRIACGCCGEIVKPRDLKLTRVDNCATVGDLLPRETASDAA